MRFPNARTRRIAVAVASALLGIVALVHLRDPLAEGVTATFFPDPNWSSAPFAAFVDPELSTATFARQFGGQLPDTFSATWIGTLAVLRTDTYTFAAESDDAAWVYVDDVLVVDDSGHHAALRSQGSIPLDRGPHRLLVKYAQYGGEASLALWWGRRGGALERLSSTYLFPRRADLSRLLVSIFIRELVPYAVWLWAAVVCVAMAGAAEGWLRRLTMAMRTDPLTRTLTIIVGVSVVLNVIGIWWGAPSEWAGDEIAPTTVRYALERHFSSGWFDRYPPLQMEVLGAVFSPWLLFRAARLIQVSERAEYGVLLVLGRTVSIVAAAATVLVVYRIAAETFGRRAGTLSAAALALLTPFLYYAKTANPEVPYVFWFSLSLLFFLRALRTCRIHDVLGFALAATLSICTKDQAYGLYLLTPIPLLFRLWQWHRDNGAAAPAFVRAILDRRLWIPFAAAVALFALVHNIPFNPAGFVAHVRDITGAGQEGYQMVDATWRGRLSLLRIVADLNQRSWGWPFSLMAVAGLCIAVANRATRAPTVAMLLIAVSYYLGFINVIRYVFDRYLLPVCVIEAVLIGVAFDRVLRAGDNFSPPAVRVAAIAMFAYTALYAGMVDVLMVRDARYSAERWLHDQGGNRSVGIMFPATVLPRLHDLHVAEIRSVEDLRNARPDFFILNADYARAVPHGRPEGELAIALQQGTVGYRLALRSAQAPPWAWLPAAHPNLVGPRDEVPVLSVLTEVNPTIEIYARHGGDRVR